MRRMIESEGAPVSLAELARGVATSTERDMGTQSALPQDIVPQPHLQVGKSMVDPTSRSIIGTKTSPAMRLATRPESCRAGCRGCRTDRSTETETATHTQPHTRAPTTNTQGEKFRREKITLDPKLPRLQLRLSGAPATASFSRNRKGIGEGAALRKRVRQAVNGSRQDSRIESGAHTH